MTETIKTTKREKVAVDVRVICEFNSMHRAYGQSVEKSVALLQREATDFEQFVRDHRSQDAVRLKVEVIEETRCTACGKEWDTMYYNRDDFETDEEYQQSPHKRRAHCGWCGAMEERENSDEAERT